MAMRSWNALYRSLLLVALVGFLVRLLLNGNIIYYIHPRFVWFTWVACGGLALMLVGQLRELSKESRARVPEGYYLILVGVMTMGFVVKPHTFSADLATKQGLNLTNRSSGSSPPKTEAAPLASGASEPLLVVDSANFVSFLEKMYNDPEAFAGKRVAIEGFTFYPPNVTSDEFAIVRLVVTCHVAHAAPDGLVVTVPGQTRPETDTWHRAEGTLEPYELNGVKLVRLVADELIPIEEPAVPYVFPPVSVP